MKCSVCQHDMVPFNGGWRCPNCGHTEGIVDTVNTVSPGSLVMPGGVAAAAAASSVLPSAPPIQGATPRPAMAADMHEARPAVAAAPPRVASDIQPPVRQPMSPPPASPAAPAPTSAPTAAAAEPKSATTQTGNRQSQPVPRAMTDFRPNQPARQSLDNSKTPVNPQPEPPTPIAPTPILTAISPLLPEPKLQSIDEVLDHAAIVLGETPPPLVTPPPRRPNPLLGLLRVIIFLAVAAASAYSVYTFWQVDPLGWFKGQKVALTPKPTVSESATPAASDTPTPTATPSPTATPAPTPSSTADSRDDQRKSDLAAYQSAYSATRFNGYMPTQPQAIDVHRNDPSTNAEYSIITSGDPDNLGQIYYKAGGRCTAPSITPGTSGTHYVALIIKLETQSDLYCVDVP